MTGMILLLLLGVLVFVVIGVYNRLVALKNRWQNAFAQIEVQLKRRYDLIPNLVETAKGYMAHERETLEAVIAARNSAVSGLAAAAAAPSDGAAVQALAGAENAVTQAMSRFSVVMEAYPDLKANQNMLQLSEELSSTENRVAFARQAFNDAVMDYNSYKQSFPAVMFAGSFGHAKDATLLEFADSAAIQAAPVIKF
jgi:LemA protein